MPSGREDAVGDTARWPREGLCTGLIKAEAWQGVEAPGCPAAPGELSLAADTSSLRGPKVEGGRGEGLETQKGLGSANSCDVRA